MADTELDIAEVAEAGTDPGKLAAFMEKISSKMQYVGDEDGEKIKVFNVNDIKLADVLVNLPPHMVKMGLGTKDVRQMQMREDDVLVISYPKTGTHWSANLLRFLLMDGSLEDQSSFQPPLIDLFPSQQIEAMPSPRVLATHYSPSLAPQAIFQGKGKAVLIYRNPKDTAVSHYYHMMKMRSVGDPLKMSWNAFIDGWLKGLVSPGLYTDFYNVWQKSIEEKKDDLKILVICYEDLKKEPLREVRRMSEFLGRSNSDERLQQVIDKCSINNLRSDVNEGKVKSPLVDKEGKSFLYRKGIIGDWRNYFTVAQNEIMDSILEEKFTETMFISKY